MQVQYKSWIIPKHGLYIARLRLKVGGVCLIIYDMNTEKKMRAELFVHTLTD
jgi:hypothetical protein